MTTKLPAIAVLTCLPFVFTSTARAQGHVSQPEHTHERAGNPLCVASYARPSVTNHDRLGYVGGGKVIGGDCRGPRDGTFGMDYVGLGWFGKGNFLNWFHDRKLQPSPGKYNTEGPKVPDVVANNPVKLAHKALAGEGK